MWQLRMHCNLRSHDVAPVVLSCFDQHVCEKLLLAGLQIVAFKLMFIRPKRKGLILGAGSVTKLVEPGNLFLGL